MSLAEEPLGVADPALDVAAEPVVVLVGLSEPVELRGCVSPRLVDLGLGRRGRSLGRRGEVPFLRRRGGPFLGGGGGLLGGGPRGLRLLEVRPELLRILRGRVVPFGSQPRETRVERGPVAPEGLDHHPGLDGRLRERRELRDRIRAGGPELGQPPARGRLCVAHAAEALGEQLLLGAGGGRDRARSPPGAPPPT